jgi:hypothetical protein
MQGEILTLRSRDPEEHTSVRCALIVDTFVCQEMN